MSHYAVAILVSVLSSFFFLKNEENEQNLKSPDEHHQTELSLAYATAAVDTPPPNSNNGPGDPPSRDDENPFELPTPIDVIYELDEEGKGFNIFERIGNTDLREPSYISLDDYGTYRRDKAIQDNWKDMVALGDDITPAGLQLGIDVDNPAFKDIFGGGSVEIRPNGTALLEFSGDVNRNRNPSLPVRQQRTGNFNFDQQIQLNVVGKIGEKLRINANWDTEATFDFENQFKVGYQGSEDEIIQSIEAGNVSLPLKGSLISGGQNLFGIKLGMKFGPLLVTTIVSQQKGKQQSVTTEGGAEVTDFEKDANDYDDNRHFFLAHHFRNRYEAALSRLPNINSGYQFTRIEVWITNTNSAVTTNNRNAVGFIDLGEQELFNVDAGIGNVFNTDKWGNPTGGYFPDNNTNGIGGVIMSGSEPGYRRLSSADSLLKDPVTLNLNNGSDYEIVENMRLLRTDEYKLNSQLGFISLNSRLQENQVLFVSYEYLAPGADSALQVGEFTQDKPAPDNQLLFLKMLKPSSVQPIVNGEAYPGWDLQMKNLYSIGGFGIRQENFKFEIFYKSPTSAGDIAYLPDGSAKNIPLIQLTNLDQLTNNSTSQPDNQFDFIEGVTIQSNRGVIIFPVLEPFGSSLAKKFKAPTQEEDSTKYTFPQLYSMTKADAINLATEADRYVFKGSYQGSSSNEIQLNAINIADGSVVVTANGMVLQENVDYRVDYQIGKVTIINQGLLTSGQEIKVDFETNTLFGIESKTLLGVRFDLDISKELQLGATILHMNERPLTNKINIGDEPLSNTLWGFDGSIRKESRLITKIIDKLPFLQTKEISNITAMMEFAQLLPGHPKAIQVENEDGTVEEGIAYLDDYESAKTTFDLSGYRSWFLASNPGSNGNNILEDPSINGDPLSSGYTRGKVAWYSIDPSFFFGNPNDVFPKSDLDNHYSRQIKPNEVFKEKDLVVGDNILRTMDVQFNPKKKGPNNYQADANKIDQNGTLSDHEKNWGGIMRKTSGNTDFEATNYEFIEFWVLDPFIYNESNGGKMYLNLGKVNEDVLPDQRRSYENGLPESGDYTTADTTAWAIVPSNPAPTVAFSNDPDSRQYQDVGYDGMTDAMEGEHFQRYLDSLLNNFGAGSPIYQDALADPSGDNYHYFRGDDLNDANTSILDRYLEFNNSEGNTPLDAVQNGFSTQGSANPESEDINSNGTLNTQQSYWEYEIPLSKPGLENGSIYVVDRVKTVVALPNEPDEEISWYQIRIPLSAGTAIGGIQNFKSIDFIRLYLADFDSTVILRFAKFQLVSTSWRTYKSSLRDEDEDIIVDPPSTLTSFQIGTINIEENSDRKPYPYVVPPSVQRQKIIGSIQQQGVLQNEQAMVLSVCDLEGGDARGAYKVNPKGLRDLRSYKRIKMWMHAEPLDRGGNPSNFENRGDLTGFIRLGTDNSQNYYEYEIPLTPMDPAFIGSKLPEDIWPEFNQIDFDMGILNLAKSERNETALLLNKPELNLSRYTVTSLPDLPPGHKIHVKGVPKLSEVKSIMVGVRNPDDGNGAVCAQIWVNELRVVDFNESPGEAISGRVNIKLADLGNISISGQFRSPGFGGLEQKINARSRETLMQYDLSGNFQLGKFFPKKWGLEIPLYLTWGEKIIKPQYNPLEPDVLMKDFVKSQSLEEETQKQIAKDLRTYTLNKSFSLNNIRKVRTNQEGKPHFWDIENIALSFSVSQTEFHNHQTERRLNLNHRASFKYSYTFRPILVQPFKKWKAKNPISMFNFYLGPKSFSFTTSGNRRYEENVYRPTANGFQIPTTYFRDLQLSRNYNLRWDLTQSISINYSATNSGRLDEPLGSLDSLDQEFKLFDELFSFGREETTDSLERDSIGYWKKGKDNLFNVGRDIRFNQNINVNYTLPLDKWKWTNFLGGNVSYSAGLNWLAAPDNNPRIGNMISNSQNIRGQGRLNLTKLYEKIPFLKKMMDNSMKGKEKDKKKKEDKKKSKENEKEEDGKEGEEEEEEDSDPFYFLKVIGREIGNIFFSVRNVDVNYNRTAGTSLPGYMPNTDNFGFDWNHFYENSQGDWVRSSLAPPTFGFMAGWQHQIYPDTAIQPGITRNDFLLKGIENGWYSRDSTISARIGQNVSETISGRTTVTMFRDLKIDLTFSRNKSSDFSALMRYDAFEDRFELQNVLETGSFTSSYIFWGTAFEKNKVETSTSKAFEEFEGNRTELSRRLFLENPNSGSTFPTLQELPNGFYQGYSANSQDVLIPAFLAAYGPGKKEKIETTPFIKVPLPNWNIRYNGLTKFEGVKDIFSSFTLKHGYKGTYTVSAFSSNTSFLDLDGDGFTGEIIAVDSIDVNGTTEAVYNFRSQYIINQISITERFDPLFGINFGMKNGLNVDIDFRMSRTINFTVGNMQLLETRSKDLRISVAWRKDKLNAQLRLFGKDIDLKNAINARLDITMRESKTRNRRLDSKESQGITNGNYSLLIKPTVDYTVNQRLNVMLFVEQNINRPYISTSFPTSFTSVGFRIRFTLN